MLSGMVLRLKKQSKMFLFPKFYIYTDVHGNSSSTSSLYIDISNICMVWYK